MQRARRLERRKAPLPPLRREIQIVFQDPHESLNPRLNAFDSIVHPLHRLGRLSSAALAARVRECAERAELAVDLLSCFPHQLSGDQKAHVGIARAIALQPRLLILDEPTAALDVSVKAVILNLLDDLRREDDLSFLFVSHDLNVVRMMYDRTIVLQQGRVVETEPSRKLFQAPQAEYTRQLLAAILISFAYGRRQERTHSWQQFEVGFRAPYNEDDPENASPEFAPMLA